MLEQHLQMKEERKKQTRCTMVSKGSSISAEKLLPWHESADGFEWEVHYYPE